MAQKTISLSADAYERLKRLKRPRESFSDVVRRLTGRDDLLRYAGCISADFAAGLRSASRGVRRRFDEDERRRLAYTDGEP